MKSGCFDRGGRLVALSTFFFMLALSHLAAQEAGRINLLPLQSLTDPPNAEQRGQIEQWIRDSLDELTEAMSGQVRYEGMPEGEATKGQSVDLKLFLRGWLPMGRWHIDVVDRNDAERRLESREHGGMA